MKFGKQLELGMYPPWKDHYIAYGRLKRKVMRRKFVLDKMAAKADALTKISAIESKQSSPNATELTPLKSGTSSRDASMESSIDDGDNQDFAHALTDEIAKINKFFKAKVNELRVEIEDISEKINEVHQSHHVNLSTENVSKLRDVFIQLLALRDYCSLNRTGVYKIVKKHDKVLGEKTLDKWLTAVDQEEFVTSNEIEALIDVVTGYVSKNKLMEWQQADLLAKESERERLIPAVKPQRLAICLLLFIISLQLPTLEEHNPHANRCLSLVIVSVSLWLTVAIPYFATALVIPVMITAMGVLRDENEKAMTPEASAKYVLNNFFNHTTMLLLGGYTISCAFSRCQFELRAAAWMQKRLGASPRLFLLAVMFLGLFLSTWISNHTAPILCASILLPLVRDLPNDSRYSKALLLGLAYACNFGGMMTPISSLQNALAVSSLEKVGIVVSFSEWLLVSIPFASLCTVLAWVVLCVIVKPDDVDSIPIVIYKRDNKLSKRNIAVLVMSFLAIMMFAFFEYMKHILGDIAMVSMIYVAIMFGTGMLSELDFNSLSWHTLFLLGGGNVLGKAVQSSGLLDHLANAFMRVIPTHSPWMALVVVFLFAMVVASFVSHTVASMILMPLIAQVGVDFGLPKVMVVGTAFVVSGAMALPFSSFPNVNSVLIVDDFQRPYLSTKDFVSTGLLLSVVSVFLMSTLGYFLIGVIM